MPNDTRDNAMGPIEPPAGPAPPALVSVEQLFDATVLRQLEHLIAVQGLVAMGVDIAEPERMRRLRSRPRALLEQVLTERELVLVEQAPEPLVQLAAAFATKEAVFKALGTSWLESAVAWSEVELLSLLVIERAQVRAGLPEDEWPPVSEAGQEARGSGCPASSRVRPGCSPAVVAVSGICRRRQVAMGGVSWQLRLTMDEGQVVALALLLARGASP